MVAVLAITGCATQAKYEESLRSWEGSDASDLVARWGVPLRTIDLDGGKKAYEYYEGQNNAIYGRNPYSNTVTQTNYQVGCATTFIISNGKVESWSYRGNICRSR